MPPAVSKVSVVIPALNEEKTIEACISSLQCQSLPPVEIILADSGSTDNTVEIARRAGARIVHAEKKFSRSAARNAGWRAAKHAAIAFCDADTIFDSRWLELTAARLNDFDSVADRRAVHRPETFYLRLLQVNYDLNYADYNPFCAWVMRRAVLEHTGGFNEALNVAEERELGARMLADGFTLGFEPKAVQFHAGKPRTFMQGIARTFRHAAGRISYYRTKRNGLPLAKVAFFFAIPSSAIFALFNPAGFFIFAFLLASAFALAFLNHAVRRNGLRVLGFSGLHNIAGLALLSVADGFAFSFGTVYGAIRGVK